MTGLFYEARMQLFNPQMSLGDFIDTSEYGSLFLSFALQAEQHRNHVGTYMQQFPRIIAPSFPAKHTALHT